MRQKTTMCYDLPGGVGSITATELSRLNHETQIEVMRNWFYANFANPVDSTPYESAEGGYIYIWGGPYEPHDELHEEFSEVVSEEVIDELANELCSISWEWTRHPEYDDDYLFDLISKTKEHKKAFQESIRNVESLIFLDADQSARKHLLRLLHVSVITIIETYLSDFFISEVENEEALLRQFIETTPEFKNEKVSYSEVFRAIDDIKKKIHSCLMKVVWHQLHKVKPMFRDTLGIEFPSDIDGLFKAIEVRHDLVHRNGKNKDGDEHNISSENVRELIDQAKAFVAHIDSQWNEKSK